jgi:RHS repeat-associated protein
VTDALNQLQEDAAYLYRYDNEGNRTARIDKQTGETTLYEWDYRNRLTTISSYDCDPEAFGNAVLQKTVTQTYDVWNQWVRRQVDSGSPLIADTYFIYDAGQLVMSFDALRGSNATEGKISRGHRYLWGPAVDQLLAEEGVKYQGSEGTLWQLTDNLGSVRDLAEYDEASGTTSVVNHITYDAFGNVTSETAAVDHLFGYTGRAYDEETDLQNNHNRWYDAASGKWLSEDPIGFAAGDANLYRYVGNSATNATDPDGQQQKNVDKNPTKDEFRPKLVAYAKEMLQCPAFRKLYSSARTSAKSVGRTLILVPSAQRPFGARAAIVDIERDDTKYSAILIWCGSTEDEAKAGILWEAINETLRERRQLLEDDAEAGRVSREDYVRRLERIEYGTAQIHHRIAAEGVGNHGWSPKIDRYRRDLQADNNFDEWYKRVPVKHKQIYRDIWDKIHREAYERQNSDNGG